MSKSVKNLLVIGIFVISMVLVLLLLVVTQPKEDSGENDTVVDTSVALVSYERDRIDNFKVTTQDGEYTVKQGVKEFTVEELEGLKVNSTVLGAAGNCITSVKGVELVEENAADLAKYSLADDKYVSKVDVTLKDGTKYTVYFGIYTPDGEHIYVRMGDSKDVYTALANSTRYFTYVKEDYISTIILPELTQDNWAPTIDLLTIKRKDLSYDIVFEDDTKNYAADDISMASSQVMISPVYAYLDITNSNDVIYGLWGLTAVQAEVAFPTQADFEEYGLADPFCEVVLNAELQNYVLKIGNVASYEKDELGNDTTTPAYFYGYFEGIDVIFMFSAGDLPWATFMPIDVLSTMMTSNYIYTLDYIDVEMHDGEDAEYYFDVDASVDDTTLSGTLNGSPFDAESFKILYQFMLKCPIDSLCLDEVAEDAKLLARIDFRREDGGGDVLEFYDDTTNRVIIKLNGTTSFSQPKSYLDVLHQNIKTFAAGGTGDELQKVW
ncbi:MAG: DUF4340 domain-containing protein [Oscillospiraceae bacterium]|nr:DUF4340 domain-containing protein [Oscillospiraceae bacterium]